MNRASSTRLAAGFLLALAAIAPATAATPRPGESAPDFTLKTPGGEPVRLRTLVEERARAYFGDDSDAPARWEPSGADFFSPSLVEADLMRRVLPPAEFRTWFAGFLPGAARGEPKTLFTPATVTDRTDPQLVHLDGLNLSRAWCMRGVAAALPAADPAGAALASSAARHAEAALGHVANLGAFSERAARKVFDACVKAFHFDARARYRRKFQLARTAPSFVLLDPPRFGVCQAVGLLRAFNVSLA